MVFHCSFMYLIGQYSHLSHMNSGEYQNNQVGVMNLFMHAANTRKLSTHNVFLRVRSSPHESRGVQAATLQGWTTGPITVVFNIYLNL